MSRTLRNPEWYDRALPLYRPDRPPPGVARLVGGERCGRPDHPPMRVRAETLAELDAALDHRWACPQCEAERRGR